MSNEIKSIVIVDGHCPPCQVDTLISASAKLFTSIKIRAAQVKSALRTTQLAAALFQFRRTIRAEPLRMPRPWPSFTRLRFGSIAFNLLPVQAHPRKIPPQATAHKWKAVFPSGFLHPRATDPAQSNFFFSYS
jgi:hypothetical protein